MTKQSAVDVASAARQKIMTILSVEEPLPPDQLINLLRSTAALASNGANRASQRLYVEQIELALRSFNEHEWQQARSASQSALELKPKSLRAKRVLKQLADKEEAFDRHMGAARQALAGDTKNLLTAREEAQAALETGWNDRAVQELNTLIETTEDGAKGGFPQEIEPHPVQTPLTIHPEKTEIGGGETLTLFVGGQESLRVLVTCEWPDGTGQFIESVLIDAMGDAALQCVIPKSVAGTTVRFIATSGDLRAETDVNVLLAPETPPVRDIETMDVRELTEAAQMCEENNPAQALAYIVKALEYQPTVQFLLDFKARLEARVNPVKE